MEEKKDPKKLEITLKVAGGSYKFTIDRDDREKEEIYRLAEREVNGVLARIKQNQFKNWSDLDYLSVVALQFASANISLRQSREVGDEDLQRLQQLDAELTDYLESQLLR